MQYKKLNFLTYCILRTNCLNIVPLAFQGRNNSLRTFEIHHQGLVFRKQKRPSKRGKDLYGEGEDRRVFCIVGFILFVLGRIVILKKYLSREFWISPYPQKGHSYGFTTPTQTMFKSI